MGNNQAGRDFEQMVIGLYDLDKLDIATLDLVGKTFYYYPDIDAGGYAYLTAKDGLDVEEVVLKMLDPDFVSADEDDAYYRFQELTEERWRHHTD